AVSARRHLLAAGRVDLAHPLLERTAHGAAARFRLLALLARAVVRDLARARLAGDDRETIAGFRRAVEAEDLDRRRRAGIGHGGAGVGHPRAPAAPLRAGPGDVAAVQRADRDHPCRP